MDLLYVNAVLHTNIDWTLYLLYLKVQGSAPGTFVYTNIPSFWKKVSSFTTYKSRIT